MSTSKNSPYVFALNIIIRSYEDYQLNDKNIDYESLGDISPISGYEPNFEPFKWNNTYAQYNHNCYAYVLNTLAPKRSGKPQPGYFSNFPPIQDNDYNCYSFYERLKKDIPSLYLTKFDEKCKKGYYKGFIALDTKKEDQDYHFYRQDRNGYWSHKPGRKEAINYDASEKKIKNPLKANRNYKYFNYSTPCFFFCMNSQFARSSSSSMDNN